VGLALVHDLVLAHHGRVEVLSSPGRGSRFVVHLPLAPPEPTDPRLLRIAGRGWGARAERLPAGLADRPAA
jgi:hypothetical protein